MENVEKLKLLSLAQITALIGRGESTLRKDVRAGRLAVTRIGRQVRVTPKSLRAFLSKQDRKRKN